jgi:restriction endonuclease Mrr
MMPFVLEALKKEKHPLRLQTIIKMGRDFMDAKGYGQRDQSIKFALSWLKKEGLVSNESRRGYWAVTADGNAISLTEETAKEIQLRQSRK